MVYTSYTSCGAFFFFMADEGPPPEGSVRVVETYTVAEALIDKGVAAFAGEVISVLQQQVEGAGDEPSCARRFPRTAASFVFALTRRPSLSMRPMSPSP